MAKRNEGRAAASGLRPEPMELHRCGPSGAVRYPGAVYSAERLRWMSLRKTEGGLPAVIRDPEESTRVYRLGGGFKAAGKSYEGPGGFINWMDGEGVRCRDVYGRELVHVCERFTCLDFFDLIHESRFRHWFFLAEGGRLTRICFADSEEKIYVTEDVAQLEEFCCEELAALGCFGLH